MEEAKVNNKPFCIAIKVTEKNTKNIAHYREHFKEINRLYKDRVKLLFLGYRPEKDKTNMLDGVVFEYTKPVSIIHHFKQFKASDIDLLFVPLMDDVLNVTSEDYINFMDSGQREIPILCQRVFPYANLIASDEQDDFNGFIYENIDTFIPYLKNLLAVKIKEGKVKLCGARAFESVNKDCNFSKDKLDSVFGIYS